MDKRTNVIELIYWKCTRGITVQPNEHSFLRFVLHPVISTSKYKKNNYALWWLTKKYALETFSNFTYIPHGK